MCLNTAISHIFRIYFMTGCSERLEVGKLDIDLCDIVSRLYDRDMHVSDDSQAFFYGESGN